MTQDEIIENLHKVIMYMGDSTEFNESSSMLYVFDAITEINLLRAQLSKPQPTSHAVRDALEQAAKICEENALEFNDPFQSNRCAKAIRALIQTAED